MTLRTSHERAGWRSDDTRLVTLLLDQELEIGIPEWNRVSAIGMRNGGLMADNLKLKSSIAEDIG